MCNSSSTPLPCSHQMAGAGDEKNSAMATPSPPPQHVYVTLIPIGNKSRKSQPAASDFGSDFFPTPKVAIEEATSLFALALPIAITALLLYSRSAVSVLFLGSLGDLPLAAGSLAVAFANITAYSVLSGLSLGMDPLCSQAFGADRPKLLSLTLQRCVLFLLCCSIPISFLWMNMSKILLLLGQDPEITSLAQRYLCFALPDLITCSLIHPIRIYLRAQSITRPLTLAATFAAAIHIPANFLLVTRLGFGVSGVAAASALSNLALLLFLLAYIGYTGVHRPTWQRPTRDVLAGWAPLVRLAGPSCASVCLEWWWYEIVILLCGLLPNPKAAVASMGVLIQTTALLYVFPSSLGLAVSTRVGNELGAARPSRARAAASVSFLLSLVMGIVAVGFATGAKDIWARMFTADPEILKLTAIALPIIGLCELGNCPQTVGSGVLRGSARPIDAANVNLGAFYLVGMPVAVGLAFWARLGFCGLWLGLLAAQVCCAGLMIYVVGSTDWETQASRALTLACAAGVGVGVSTAADDGGGRDLCGEPLISIKVGQLQKSDVIIEMSRRDADDL